MSKLGKQYWTLFASSLFSNLADGMTLAIFPMMAAQLSNSPIFIANVAMARSLPWLLVSMPSGFIIDRCNRKDVVAFAQGFRALLFTVVVVLAFLSKLDALMLMVLGFLTGVSEVFFDNTANTIVPRVISNRLNLEKANGNLISFEIVMNKFLGGPLGAGIASLWGMNIAFAFTGASYFLATVLIFFLPRKSLGVDRVSKEHRVSFRDEFLLGFNCVWGNKILKNMMIASAVGNGVYGAISGILILYSIRILDAPTWFFGILISMLGVGSFVGGKFASQVVSRIGRQRSYIFSAIVIPLGFLVCPITKNIYVSLVAFFVLGIAFTVTRVVSVSFRQNAVADHMMGKVMAVYRLASWGTLPLGTFAGGLTASWLGLSGTFYFFATVSILILIIAVSSFGKLDHEFEQYALNSAGLG